MNDFIYDTIDEMSTDVLVKNIRTFQRVIANIKNNKDNAEVIMNNMEKLLRKWQTELEKRNEKTTTNNNCY